MSFSGPTHAGSVASSGPSSSSRSYSSWSWLFVGLVAAVWVLFGVALWTSPGTLTDIWNWVLDLPMIGLIVVWVVALPWMLALAILESGWPDPAQIAAIAGLVIISIATFAPNRVR